MTNEPRNVARVANLLTLSAIGAAIMAPLIYVFRDAIGLDQSIAALVAVALLVVALGDAGVAFFMRNKGR